MDADKQVNPGYRVLTGSLILASFWCVTGLAASGTDIGCAGSESRLSSLNVAVDTLAVQPVEHLPSRTESAALSLDASETVSRAVVPILHLAPHIAAILNNVFETSGIDVAVQHPEASAVELPTAGHATRSQNLRDDGVPANVVVPNDDIARFQRQMYRKDI